MLSWERVRPDMPEAEIRETHAVPSVDSPTIDLRGDSILISPPERTARQTIYETSKRLLDVLLSMTLLAVLSPLLVVLAMIIKTTSPGPVLFRQERVGRFGELFYLLKFRTMRDGADEAHHREHYERLANGDGQRLLIEDDPRVTAIGRFLRRWSLDELPNLWNVLKGEISLVGPRPLVPYELMLHDKAYLRRLQVLPGITGLAQIEGRLHVGLEERADLDLVYVDKCSIWLDLGILTRTLPAMLMRPGA